MEFQGVLLAFHPSLNGVMEKDWSHNLTSITSSVLHFFPLLYFSLLSHLVLINVLSSLKLQLPHLSLALLCGLLGPKDLPCYITQQHLPFFCVCLLWPPLFRCFCLSGSANMDVSSIRNFMRKTQASLLENGFLVNGIDELKHVSVKFNFTSD